MRSRSTFDFIKLFFKGVFMGIADAMPGVSGGTIALLVGIYEELIKSISELNIPLDQFMIRINEIPRDKPVVIYCNSGKRSKSLKYRSFLLSPSA